MNCVILSIKPKYAKAILDGTKTFEIRKRVPRFNEGTTVFLYETAPVSAITGYFVYTGFVCAEKASFYRYHGTKLGISYQGYMDYLKDQKYVHAWRISNATRLNQPITPSELNIAKIPQFYMYYDFDKIQNFISQH